jgi:hypothetical protein
MTNLRKSALTVAIASSLALVGCGGGGGSSSGVDGPEDSGGGNTQQTSVSGNAIKGLLQNAPVTIFEVTDTGEVSVGEARTNDAGEYTVTLNNSYSGGLLRVVAGADDQTVMICDASQCGEDADGNQILKGQAVSQLPRSFELSALAEVSASDTATETSVTAWSTMAARRAAALGGDLRKASRQANAEVSELAGFDIARTRARAVTDDIGTASEEEQVSAVMNAVVAELLYQDNSGDDIASKLERFVAALEDGALGSSENEYSVSEFADRVQEVVRSTSGLSGKARDSVNNQAVVYEDARDSEGGLKPSYDPEQAVGEDTTADEKVEKFKRFVTQTKSWIQSIEQLDGEALGASVDLDVNLAQNALRGLQEGQLQFVAEVIDQLLKQLSGDPELVARLVNEGGEHDFSIEGSEGVDAANAKLNVIDDGGLALDLSGAVTPAGSAEVPFALTLQTSIPGSALETNPEILTRLDTSNSLKLTGQIGDQTTDRLILNDVTLNLALSNAVEANGDAAEIAGEDIEAAFLSGSFSGDVEAISKDGNRFAGELSAELVRLEQGGRFYPGLGDEAVSLKSLRVAGDFEGLSGTRFRTSLSFNLNNASMFDSLAWANYSNQVVGLEVPVSYDAIAGLADGLTPEENSVRNYIYVGEFTNSSGESSIGLSMYDYVTDGEDKYLSRSLSSAAALEAVDGVRAYLAESTFPNDTVRFTASDYVTGEDMEISVPVADLLAGTMSFSWAEQTSLTNRNIRIDFSFSEPLIDGFDFSGAVTAIQDDLVNGATATGDVWNNGKQWSLIFERDTLIKPESEISDIVVGLAPVDKSYEDGTASRVWFDYYVSEQNGGYGWIPYRMLSTSENVLSCIENPSDFTFPGADRKACVGLTGERIQRQELGADQKEAFFTLRDEALVNRYGEDLTSRMVVRSARAEVNKPMNIGATVPVPDNNRLIIQTEIPELESAEQFADMSVTLNSLVRIAEQPAANATLTVSRNSYRGGNALLNVRWADGNYSIALATDDAENPNSYTGRIFNAQGYELTVNVTVDENRDIQAVNGDAMINGEDIGDLELRDNGMVLLVFPNGDSNEIVSLL